MKKIKVSTISVCMFILIAMNNVSQVDKLTVNLNLISKADTVAHTESASIMPQDQDSFEPCGSCKTHALEVYNSVYYQCINKAGSTEEGCQNRAVQQKCAYLRNNCRNCGSIFAELDCLQ